MRSALRTIPIWLLAAASAFAAQPNRITAPIDGSQTVVLKGSVHTQAQPEFDQGATDPSLPLPYVVMATKPSPTQQAELEKLLAGQQDPTSANYHKWLTPEAYADRFGLSPNDTEKISIWLRSQGFSVVQVARGRDWIAFSATAGLVENTFHTQIHRYSVDGELHFANASELAIPKALAGAVAGFRGLNDFRWKPMGVHEVVPADVILPVIMGPLFTTNGGINGSNVLAPDDFATIYDLTSLYTAGIDGAGMKLVVVGQVDVVMTDIQAFRSGFNLPTNNPIVVVVPGSPNPGTNPGDLVESDLDLEWTGAVARNASIIFVTSAVSTGGVFNSAVYAIDNDLAPVISMSYGGCEAVNGAFIAANEPTMQKANAEGITFVASSGDSGAASCDAPTETSAKGGLGVSYPASSPEVTGVGGTEFSGDLPPNTSLYWNTSNGANGGSAIIYIPETSWNDTVARGTLAASGGGRSSCHSSPCSGGFPKPSWQAGTGVPNDKVRDVPDVSFGASPDHDGYILCNAGSCTGGIMNNSFAVVGGTSASTPVFAGILTLLNQQLGNTPPAGLGNVNPTLYKLAQTPANNVFHDITTGDNIVPCTKGSPNCPVSLKYGYTAAAGYDLVTGLGSIDVNNLFTNWNVGKIATTSVLGVTPITITAGSSQAVTLTAVVSPNSGSGTPTGAVAFLLNGTTPAGTATLSKGSASLSYTPTSLKAGTNTFTAAYGGDVSFVNSKSPAVMVTVEDFTVALTSSPTTVTVAAPGDKGTTSLTITPEFGFRQMVSFSCTGLPSEAACSASSVTPNGGPVMTTLTITTTAPTARLWPGSGGSGLFYALLIPGLLGVMLLPVGNGKGRFRQARLLGLIVGLVCVTLWLPACGGGASTPPVPPNPGTPVGSSTVSVVAAGTNGAPSHAVKITLTIK
jgi:subtilase family serine protease